MKKVLFFSLLVIFVLNTVFPLTSYAYSYGDPNEELLAEVYKNMKIKLNEEPPNYHEASLLFETVKEEIDMHMGLEPAKVILDNIENKDKEKITSNMQQILVLNIARRLENVEKNFSDFDTSKKILAKGFATYEALSPVIQEKDLDTDQRIRNNFDTLLNSLGNPGLFGVGVKEPNFEEFKQNKDLVYKDLQQQFNLKDIKVGHFTENGQEVIKDTNQGKKDWRDLSSIKNWIPIIIIAGVIIGIVVFALKRK